MRVTSVVVGGESHAMVMMEDHRVRAVPDGDKFVDFPPVVRRVATAFLTAQDVQTDAAR